MTLGLVRRSSLRRTQPFDQGYLTAMFGRALRDPSHSLDFDFYASILRSPFPGLVVSDRFAFTKPLSGNSTAVDALLYDVVFNRIHPPLGQCLVVGFRADAIGVAGKTRPLVFVFVHEDHQSV